MNKPIRGLAVFCLLLFIALLANVTWVQFVQADTLNAKPNNRRVLNEEFSRQRGAILVGGNAVAESVASKDDWKFQRKYVSGALYAPVTGYFSYIYGRSGLEQSQNRLLSGTDNRLFVDRVTDLLSNKQPSGGSVETTINVDAQQAAAEGLASLGKSTQGAVVAIEPKTGRILAMATQPSYDPNTLASHDLTATQRAWKSLTTNSAQPMLNRTTQLTLPPGSTFKLVTAAAAIQDLGLKANSTVQGGASLKLPDSSKPLVNENGSTCGGDRISFQQALEVSCNVSFGSIALKLGQDKLVDQAKKFGFGTDPLSGLPGASSQVTAAGDGTLAKSYLAYTGIGQYNVRATPLQMAMVAAGVANDGVVMKPYLIETQRAPNLKVLEKTEPQTLDRAMSTSSAHILRDMMVGVVDQGTGTPARISGVKVAGKTGTAQSDKLRAPYAWFVGFAPADNPKVAVAVLIQSTSSTSDIAGGRLGGPIARSVMEAILQ